MKENMFLIFVMVVGSFFLSQCTNAPANVKNVSDIQAVVNQELSNDSVLSNDESVQTSPETDQEEIIEESDNIKEAQVDKTDFKKAKEDELVKTSTVVTQKRVEESEINDKTKGLSTNDNDIPTTPITNDEINTKVISEADKPQEKLEIEKEELIVDEVVNEQTKLPVAQTTFSHDKWNTILKANVTESGKVNYNAIKSNSAQLEDYLNLLSEHTPQNSWSKNKTKAYWINAYNAFTIKLIVDNYPVGSITDLHGGKPWDEKWIKLGTKTYSLNDIEHVILRPTYNDPRIHFAVNCAAKSCPKVWNQAWTESNIESALDKLTKEFVSNTSANQLTAKSVNLSKIFEWYGDDFGDLIQFLNKYSKTKISSDAKVAFNDYNWKLNS